MKLYIYRFFTHSAVHRFQYFRKRRLCTCASVFVTIQADPYVQVKLGTTKVDTSDDYVPNSLNPVFGK